MRGFWMGAAGALMLALAGCTSDQLVGAMSGIYATDSARPREDGSMPGDGRMMCEELTAGISNARTQAAGLEIEANEIERGQRPANSPSQYRGVVSAPERMALSNVFKRRAERLTTRWTELGCGT